jgi:FRG domain
LLREYNAGFGPLPSGPDYEPLEDDIQRGYIATAQHYGLPTALLDFTADSEVAVAFACLSNNADPKKPAVVFGLPLGLLDDHAGMVLPPPFVKRLYRQRGLFIDCANIDCSSGEAAELRKICLEVRFPFDPSLKILSSDFAQRTDGDARLLPKDPWLTKVVR